MKKIIVQIFYAVASLLAFGMPAFAMSQYNVTDSSMIAASPLIVRGKVEYIGSRFEGASIYTVTRLAVLQTLKGTPPGGAVLVKQPGGVVGNTGESVPGVAEFKLGEEVVVYLTPSHDGYYQVTDFGTGKFSVSGAGPAAVLTRQTAGIAIFGPKKGYTPPAQTISLDSLQTLIAQTPDKSPKILPPKSLPAQYKTDLQAQTPTGATPLYTLMSGPFRYFDNTLPTTLYVNTSNNPLGNATQAAQAVQDGLNAWNNAVSSNIINYGGTTTDTGGNQNSTKTVAFNDPKNEIANPVGCAGTLGRGGSNWQWPPTKVVNGTTFYQGKNGYITFNNGWTTAEGCNILDVYNNLIEVMAHETGHVIGLSHSADSAALMYPTVHFGGYGAKLAQDDKDGLYFAYAELKPGSDTTAPTTSINPTPGSYSTTQSVTMTCDDGSGGSGCDKTYYTMDGTTPTTSSAVYASALTVASTVTIKYFSTDKSANQESVNTATYTITGDVPALGVAGILLISIILGIAMAISGRKKARSS